ncbi:DHS-like NAD/FAD-binding domain-containing protein [Pelagophyceae sp. CCMP2097]|nr:DHS-like NAD/FAD-binding domain-containing protein [Pelagophyceae sp. CCMP2097]
MATHVARTAQGRAATAKEPPSSQEPPRPRSDIIQEIAALIATSKNVVVITGAGLSVASGIAAFRSGAGAVWSANVTTLGTRKEFKKDAPKWYNEFWLPAFECERVRSARPSRAHDDLAFLCRLSAGVKVVTQNVDGLHVNAVPDAQLVEAHGRVGLYRCARFGGAKKCAVKAAGEEWFDESEISKEDVMAIRALHVEKAPACPKCGGTLVPLALLFDEMYDTHFFFEAEAWDSWLDEADAVLFIGTSFVVEVTREALRRAKDKGVPVYNVNVDV